MKRTFWCTVDWKRYIITWDNIDWFWIDGVEIYTYSTNRFRHKIKVFFKRTHWFTGFINDIYFMNWEPNKNYPKPDDTLEGFTNILHPKK